MSETKPKPACGIVMPISGMEGCSESHWSDVLDILTEAIDEAGFQGNLVSNADDVGIIHKRIIQNLYDNPMVVCDVSGKNPNVMFELGLRLAFDKPTIIIKDDKTSYSFDTSAIEHLEYPRDLRFTSIVAFKQKLAEKIVATYTRATTDPSYTTFLKHFGEFTVAKLDKKEVSGQEFILEELRSIRTAMRRFENEPISAREGVIPRPRRSVPIAADINICMEGADGSELDQLFVRAHDHPDVEEAHLLPKGNHRHLLVKVKPGANVAEVKKMLQPRKATRSLITKNVSA
jgi:hypothetical protein